MSKVKSEEEAGFYLPHFVVIREDLATTKVRVVFDGSVKSESGISLNNVLMIGPTIQNDVFAHMIRFRSYKFVLTGDIEKMYRQFVIREEDRKFQRMFWRRDGKNIEVFELNTVTFKTSSSSFLATRALQQLADDEGDKYPEAAKILKEDVYVDDCITGAKTVKKGIEKRK